MLLKVARWHEIERMPAFERDYYFKEAVDLYTDKKSGKITIPA